MMISTISSASSSSRMMTMVLTILLVAMVSVVSVEGSSRSARYQIRQLSAGSLSRRSSSSLKLLSTVRGGSLASSFDEDEDEEDEDDTNDITKHPDFPKLQAYRMKQQLLLQLRSTYLSEALAKRGIPLPTVSDVSTPDGKAPPKQVDWDCAVSTEDEPKTCMYTYDAVPGTKLIAPFETQQWITLVELNGLRRKDPSKVEPMWHDQYAILKSWFNSDSEYSLLQHVGIKGFLLNALLEGHRLHVAVALGLVVAAVVFMPVIEYVVNRFLVCGLLWAKWPSWARFLHAALPLKLLLFQMAFRYIGKIFLKLVGIVKVRLVELESQILEQMIPLTVGPGSERPLYGTNQEEEDNEDSDDEGDLSSDDDNSSEDDSDDE